MGKSGGKIAELTKGEKNEALLRHLKKGVGRNLSLCGTSGVGGDSGLLRIRHVLFWLCACIKLKFAFIHERLEIDDGLQIKRLVWRVCW